MELNEILLNDSSKRLISILTIGIVTIIILWTLLFLKNRKLKEKIKRLEDN